MTNLYALALAACGLSDAEAAALHKVRNDTVRSWVTGRRRAPDAVTEYLIQLAHRQVATAQQGLSVILEKVAELGPPTEPIELGLCSDDHEARAIGWPCVSAQRRTIELLIGMLGPDIPVSVVPRGSTPATAGAADAQDRPRG